MQRPLSALQIPSSQLSRLTEAGFSVVEDFLNIKPCELSEETGISKEEALSLLQLVREGCKTKTSSAAPKTALQLLELPQDGIVTFCQALDDALGGGVPVGKITEFCGAPGIGKTQMCIQLAVDVQVPCALGGLGGQAVYIDTEGSFMVDRVMDVVAATQHHCEQVSAENIPSVDHFLAGIHLVRCLDYVQLLAFTHLLPEFLSSHSEVKLIIIDSIAFPFRHGFEDFALRTRILNGLSQTLIRIATEHKLAVVLTNQMTTRVSGGSSHLVPALGESWGHASTLRLILYWKNTRRNAMLYKAPHAQETSVQYQITTGGIRDVAAATNNSQENEEEEEQPTKRTRLES